MTVALVEQLRSNFRFGRMLGSRTCDLVGALRQPLV
jgi:hypothetical protein